MDKLSDSVRQPNSEKTSFVRLSERKILLKKLNVHA